MQKPWGDRLRVRVAGRVLVEQDERAIRDTAFPSRQALLAFVFLIAERRRLATADEIADVIWADTRRPDAWDNALTAILSKLRALLRRVCPDGIEIVRRFRAIQLGLPSTTWIDLEAAGNAIDEAEGLWRADRVTEAWGAANVAACLASEPLLPGEDGAWLHGRRAGLQGVLIRALQVLSDTSLANREPDLAALYAQRLVDAEPLVERHYRRLMRLQAEIGNRGEALRVYGTCRERLRDELGTNPSSETEAMFLKILRA